jgi:hypothetical protein
MFMYACSEMRSIEETLFLVERLHDVEDLCLWARKTWSQAKSQSNQLFGISPPRSRDQLSHMTKVVCK